MKDLGWGFMVWQVIYNIVTGAVSYFLYFNFYIQTAFIVYCYYNAIKNGASYYLNYFVKCYEQEMQRIDQITSESSDFSSGESKDVNNTSGE